MSRIDSTIFEAFERMRGDSEIWLHPVRTYRDYKVKQIAYTHGTQDLRLFEELQLQDERRIHAYVEELHTKHDLFDHLESSLGESLPYDSKLGIFYKAEILYYLTRIVTPDIVVETGVNAGVSSTFFLEAMRDNNRGHLFSLDLPPVQGKYGRSYPETFGKSSGWIIPQDLRRNWTLELGSSRENLANMLAKLEHIDLFFHDSLHTYENQWFEYETAWRYLGPDGLLVSDDIGLAFFEFARTNHQSHGTFRETGVIKKH